MRSGPSDARVTLGGRPSVAMMVIALAMVGAGVMIVFAAGRMRGPSGGEVERLRIDESALESRRAFIASMNIPEFSLIDQDGARVGREVLRGQRTVLVFTFTHCPTACPVMMGLLLPVYHSSAAKDVRFVSISVDPVNDTAERLKQHAESMGVNDGRWRFLTGDAEQIRAIVAGLKFAISENAADQITLPGGGTMANIVHPTKALLIDREGVIVDFFDALTRDGVDELAARLAR